MESLSRVILFLTSYFIVLALSFSINTESEYLQSGLFLVISIIIATWLYYLHFKKKEVQEFARSFPMPGVGFDKMKYIMFIV